MSKKEQKTNIASNQEAAPSKEEYGHLWTAKEYARQVLFGPEKFLVNSMALKGGLAVITYGLIAGVSYIAALPFVLYTGAVIGLAVVASVATYAVFRGGSRLWASLKNVHNTVRGKKHGNTNKPVIDIKKRGKISRWTYEIAKKTRAKRIELWNKIQESAYWKFVQNAPLTKKIKSAPIWKKMAESEKIKQIRDMVQDKEPAFKTVAATGAAFTIMGAVVIAAEVIALPILGFALAGTTLIGFVAWGGYALYRIGKDLVTPNSKEKKPSSEKKKITKTPVPTANNDNTLSDKKALSDDFSKTSQPATKTQKTPVTKRKPKQANAKPKR